MTIRSILVNGDDFLHRDDVMALLYALAAKCGDEGRRQAYGNVADSLQHLKPSEDVEFRP